jgi:predicted transposase YdaD
MPRFILKCMEVQFQRNPLLPRSRLAGKKVCIQQGIDTELRLILQCLHRKGQTSAQIAELLQIPLAQVEQFLQDATS